MFTKESLPTSEHKKSFKKSSHTGMEHAGWNSPYTLGSVAGGRIQTKLAIGAANDKYEVEADRMADHVVSRMSAGSAGESVQRACSACESEEKVQTKVQRMEEEESLQMKPMISRMEDEEESMQMKSAIQRSGDGSMEASADIESQIRSSKGGGSPLADSTRSSMESAFGTDFSSVRVHTGNQAVQMSRDLNAQAFTHGSDVYFNSGKYSPDSNSGQRLLAHELTHVVQQS